MTRNLEHQFFSSGRQGLAGYWGKGNIFFLTNKSVFLNEQIRKLSGANFFICLQHHQQQQQQQQTGLLRKCSFFCYIQFSLLTGGSN